MGGKEERRKNGEREDSDEAYRERYEQASHLLEEEKWASEEGF